MTRWHVCRSAWLYLLAACVAAGVAIAQDVAGGRAIDPSSITTPALQGVLGWAILTELSRWRELASSALADLRDGRLKVLHEHLDVDGHPVERRRPTRPRGKDASDA